MIFPQFEADAPHVVYMILAAFLILFALFSEPIRNRLHLSEPPLALAVGIILGTLTISVEGPIYKKFSDVVTQEITRIIVGLQVFTVGIDLPAGYLKIDRHWKSLSVLLVPVMVAGWFISAGILWGILKIKFSTALIIAATLTPTDPVLSASVLGEAKFSSRIPKRLKRLLSAESGCNDGSAFPFLYAAVYAVLLPKPVDAVKWWFLETIFWQCALGIVVGVTIGIIFNRLLRLSESRGYVQDNTLFVFYFLLAILSVGVGSTLGMDDFLVAFSSGAAFNWDGWFAKKTRNMKLPSIIDLLLNASTFVYFGALIPWEFYRDNYNPGKMIACLVLILLFRRIPAILLLKRFIPTIHTYGEALFAGHFGPMGIGALFLAIEARAVLETGTASPMPAPPIEGPNKETIDIIWPIVCFIVLGSVVVHGTSALGIALVGRFLPHPTKEETPLLGAESDRLRGMGSEDDVDDDSSDTESGLNENGPRAEE